MLMFAWRLAIWVLPCWSLPELSGSSSPFAMFTSPFHAFTSSGGHCQRPPSPRGTRGGIYPPVSPQPLSDMYWSEKAQPPHVKAERTLSVVCAEFPQNQARLGPLKAHPRLPSWMSSSLLTRFLLHRSFSLEHARLSSDSSPSS